MSIYKRYSIFTIGILIQAAGISLVVKSLTGTSPISSLPYVLSLVSPYSLGTTTFAINMIFLLAQILILRHKFNPIQLLQIPVTIIFALGIDLTMFLFNPLTPANYFLQCSFLLLGAAAIALGVSLQVIANVVMLPGEGLVTAISHHWQFDFGKVKTFFDTSLVIFAAALSFLSLGTIYGIREGTLVSALITGSIARFFIHYLSLLDKNGNLIFAPHLRSRH